MKKLIKIWDVYTSLRPGEMQCACTTVKKLSRVLGRVYDSKVSSVGLNITQHAVLRCISRRSGEPLVRIAEELEMDRTSLYRALTPMIRDGWVASPNAIGSRFRTARLTKAGRRILDSANQKWADVQGALTGRFGQASYDSLLAELYRLADCAADVDEPAIKIEPPT
jgi:DNA-binding MarR family transcriptional regulator